MIKGNFPLLTAKIFVTDVCRHQQLPTIIKTQKILAVIAIMRIIL